MTAHYKFKNKLKIQLKNENKSYSKSWLKFMSFASSFHCVEEKKMKVKFRKIFKLIQIKREKKRYQTHTKF